MSTNGSEREMLSWQFDLVWRLAGYHLPLLTDEECLWEPAPGSWSVRQRTDGSWHADWAEPVPDRAPPTTIGWLTWHILWWWGSASSALRNENIAEREAVRWPGNAAATIDALNALSTQWADVLSRATDLERPVAYPWSEPRPLRLLLAWANCELMKNVAEIGMLRHLFAASHRSPHKSYMG